jgi:cytochrome P450
MDIFIITLLIVLLTTIIILFNYNNNNKKKKNQTINEDKVTIPSPPIDSQLQHHGPLIAQAGSMKNFVGQLHDQYGSIVQFNLTPHSRIVSVNDPELLKQTLKMGSRPKDLFKFLEPLLGEDNLQVYDSVRGAAHRKLVRSAVGYQFMKNRFQGMVDIAEQKVQELKKDTKEVKMQQSLLSTAMKIAIKFLVGSDAESLIDYEEFRIAYNQCMQLTLERQTNPLDEKKTKELAACTDYVALN